MFVNYSNHSSENWSIKEIAAASEYGQIVDVPFAEVDPNASPDDVHSLALTETAKILELNPDAVMCQGEMTLMYNMVNLLKENNIRVVAATSERKMVECLDESGKTHKHITFEFVRFREY